MAMQILPTYKQQLDPRFLAWYAEHFVSTRRIYGHWSAGKRETNFDDYHAVTVELEDGSARTITNYDPMLDLPGHTYGRNHNSIGICVAGMFGAGPSNLGEHQPTPNQLREHLLYLSLLCMNHRIPVGNYMTHQEAADMLDYEDPYDADNLGAPPYGPVNGRGQWKCYRWDWWVDVDVAKLKLYPLENGGKTRKPGRLFFPDWLRGEAILEVQKRSRHKWDVKKQPE